MKDNVNFMITGPVLSSLMRFSIPVLFSLLLQAFYGAVDLWMVGRFGSRADVSAVATGSQTMLIVNGMITGLAMGITILLGQARGQRDDGQSADIIGASAWIFTCIGIFLTVFLFCTAENLAVILHAPEGAFQKTVHYIMICGGGTLLVVGFNVLNGIFCGLGDSKTPLMFVLAASAVNITGDFILIYWMHQGASGAAWATITAQAFSVVLAAVMIRKKIPFPVRKENMKFNKNLAGYMVKLGLPIALLRMCSEISYLIIIGLVNQLGVTASSGVGIAEKLVMFILLIPTAYMSSISAFTAQNVGAGQMWRARKILWTGMAAALAIGGSAAYISFFHGGMLSSLFIDDPQVIAASSEFLKATALECFILSLAYCYEGYFNGIGKTGFVMLQGISAALLVRIPYAYSASIRPEPVLFEIGMSSAWAALFMLAVCSIYYIIIRNKEC